MYLSSSIYEVKDQHKDMKILGGYLTILCYNVFYPIGLLDKK